MNAKDVTVCIRRQMFHYIKDAGLKSLVIGVSGGIDSAVVCALAKPVCDDLGIKLIGRSIPISTNKSDEIDRARMIGEAYCHDFEEVELDEQFGHIRTKLMGTIQPNTLEEKIRAGNIKARLRMILLYDIAQANGGMVLSTDNYTELMVGFWTLHGDVGDYGPIQSLWKTEVYELAEYLASENYDSKTYNAMVACKVANPTDGLGVNNSDLDQLGAKDYTEVDNILQEYFDWIHMKGLVFNDMILRVEGHILRLEKHPVIQRHLRTQFKRDNPFNIARKDIIGLL